MNRFRAIAVLLSVCTTVMCVRTGTVGAHRSNYFVIRIVDQQTGRGVPLVALRLPNEVRYWTDSGGYAAIDEPSFRGRTVFIEISSDGYTYEDETPLGRGVSLRIQPGVRRTLSVRRTMPAERLYRLTGEGIYRDSVLIGAPVPAKHPLLNANVVGQDTASASIYRGRVFWIWGDTAGPTTWNFSVTAATSELTDNPDVAINYRYFTDSTGWVKAMLPLPAEGLVWVEGLVTLRDPKGRERLVATYTRQQGLKFPDECGLALFNDVKEVFEPWFRKPCTKEHTSSHPFLFENYWYLYPSLRVPNDWVAIQDLTRWEPREVTLPPNAKRPTCVVWNNFRQRWIMLLEDTGTVYYAEAERPEGPYGNAVQIVRHAAYNFYNVVTHPFFNRANGRIIYFEGTYTDAFSSAKEKTPRYNYNQIMYRLDLADTRLNAAKR